MNTAFQERLEEVVAMLNQLEKRAHAQSGSPTFPAYISWTEKRKWVTIAIGVTNTFLVDKFTGEIYHLTGQGRPDHAKKKRENLGTLWTVDPAYLHTRRTP